MLNRAARLLLVSSMPLLYSKGQSKLCTNSGSEAQAHLTHLSQARLNNQAVRTTSACGSSEPVFLLRALDSGTFIYKVIGASSVHGCSLALDTRFAFAACLQGRSNALLPQSLKTLVIFHPRCSGGVPALSDEGGRPFSGCGAMPLPIPLYSWSNLANHQTYQTTSCEG